MNGISIKVRLFGLTFFFFELPALLKLHCLKKKSLEMAIIGNGWIKFGGF